MKARLHSLVVAVVAVLCLAASVAGAETAPLVDRAINAAGGAEKLARLDKGLVWKASEAQVRGGVKGKPATVTISVRWPDAMRIEREDGALVIHGDKGWTKEKGQPTAAMPKDDVDQFKTLMFVSRLMLVFPLADKNLTIKPAAARKINDRPADGLRVSHKTHGEINLYFDRETALLVQLQRVDGDEVIEEITVLGHKEFAGVKVPGKVTVKETGEVVRESETLDFRVVDKFDDATFAAPK